MVNKPDVPCNIDTFAQDPYNTCPYCGAKGARIDELGIERAAENCRGQPLYDLRETAY